MGTTTGSSFLFNTQTRSVNGTQTLSSVFQNTYRHQEEQLDAYEGYTLFSPEYSSYTYLINNNGRILHWWKSEYIQSFGVVLGENGNLYRLDLPYDNPIFRSGGMAGRVEIFDEESTLLWAFEYSDENHCLHHDIEVLPNGNILMIAWEYKTRDEAINAGRNPSHMQTESIWPDHVIEVEPIGSSGGIIVWEWHVWDHLIQDYDPAKDNYGIVEEHPELLDINYGNDGRDWNHLNSIAYNEVFDQIVLSCKNFNEIWVIDHSTTTEEAAGHTGGTSGKGGDILFRWGNPQTYRAGTESDRKFYGQHDTTWIEEGYPGEGNLLVFNNGGWNRHYSTVDEITPPVDSQGNYHLVPGEAYGPEEQTWVYTADPPESLSSSTVSSAQRLPNGNTLICSGNQGLFLEVTTDQNIVWRYWNILPSPFTNAVAQIRRYAPDYPGIPDAVSTNQGSVLGHFILYVLSHHIS